MLSEWAFTALVLGTGAERLNELRISRRNLRTALARGGREYGTRHFPVLVVLHTGLLVGALAEVWLLGRIFVPGLGIPALAVALLCQAGRIWIIRSLGEQWNTRIVVVPGAGRVRRGPYRWAWLRHPNYLLVVVEGVALPLVHSAWITALVFSLLNTPFLLAVRIPAENRALRALDAAS